MKHSLYDNIKLVVNPIPVTASASGKLTTGVVVDRMGKRSGVLAVAIGTITGSPTAVKLKIEVTTCDTSTGTYAAADADYVVPGGAIEMIVTSDTTYTINLDLIGQKQYIKLVPTVTITGGTSPTVPITGTALVLGDPTKTPVE